MLVTQAYRFALDPTPRQGQALASHCGAARFAYNWGLTLVKRRLDERATDPEVEVPWTMRTLRREWNLAKREIAPWWADNSKEAYNSGMGALARALKNWSDSRSGKRAGRRVGFPKFKRKGRSRDTCRFTTGAIRVEPDRHHVTLPRLGRIKTHESTRKLARRLEQGSARIMAATISRTAGRWFVSFTCQVERAVPLRPSGPAIGVDVGIRHLAVLSTGEVIANPRPLDKALRRLAHASRALSRTQDGSTGRREAVARLAELHARIANLRRDRLHQLTTRLTRTHKAIVIEDLHVAGMLRNRRLARHVSDVALAELRRQLSYKTAWHGGRLLVADRWYPSSKTCSACGLVKATLGLTERTLGCEHCGLVLDRDLNAARNLAQFVAGSGPETVNAHGGDVRPELHQADPDEVGSQQPYSVRLAPSHRKVGPPLRSGHPLADQATVTVHRTSSAAAGAAARC
jgi:putative transposase